MANSHCHRIESFSRVLKLYLLSQPNFSYRRRRLAQYSRAGEPRRTSHTSHRPTCIVAYKLIFADENVSTFRDNNIAVYTADAILVECFQNNKIFFALYFFKKNILSNYYNNS